MDINNHTLEEYMEGKLLLINKPYHWTSFDVVGKLRNAFKPLKLKVGHAGTLDPLATGLLIICTGKMTKQIDTFQAEEKEYTGTLVLGATTPSYDLETEVDQQFDISHITEEAIKQATEQFTGDIQQYPPAHSAIKVSGERLYEKARRGEEVQLKARNVTIKEFEITAINLPEVEFRVICSKGTYIRSLVHDFGKALNSGAYLSRLRRTRSGNFRIEDAHEILTLVSEIRKLQPKPNHPREKEILEPEQVKTNSETGDPSNYTLLKEYSGANRHAPTRAENIIWQLLRDNSTGYKIRRQHSIGNYIADFVCLQKGLVIEIDGKNRQIQQEADEIRTEMLNNLGFKVIRVNNDEVLSSPDEVLNTIKETINSLPDRQKALPTGNGLGGAL